MDQANPKPPATPRSPGNERGFSVCPHLGLATDPFINIAEPSAEHRCYLWMQRERIDPAHQVRYCLTETYSSCPWLAVSRHSGTADSAENPWQQLREAVRERFDDLERVTMRSSWPKAVLAVVVFLVQVSILFLKEGRRLAGPASRRAMVYLRRFAHWYVENVHPVVMRELRIALARVRQRLRPGSMADVFRQARPPKPRPIVAASAARPVAAEPAPRPEVGEPTATARPATVQPRDDRATEELPLASWLVRWDCTYCAESNPSGNVLCQRCGRLSTVVEEELRARREFAVLDGLKALQMGDEEVAHRHFTRATKENPTNSLAWQWRMRTAPAMADVVVCLENLVRLNPRDPQLAAELTVARARQEVEAKLAVAAKKAKKEEVVAARPKGPSTLGRVVAFVRRLCLELASIPCFVLGLLWLGQPIREVLDMLGLSPLKAFVPVFRLPTVLVNVPDGVPAGVLPATVDATGLVLAAVAIWYLRLAFQVADGPKGSRYRAIASGLAGLVAVPLIVAGGSWFLLASVLLVALAVLGQGRTREEMIRAAMGWSMS